MKTYFFTRFLYVSIYCSGKWSETRRLNKNKFFYLSVSEKQAKNSLTHFNRFETALFFLTRVNILDQQ